MFVQVHSLVLRLSAVLVSWCVSGMISSPADVLSQPTEGRKLAQAYCATCHVFPEPELLDKKTWRSQTLPRMKIRMGLAPQQIDSHPEGKLLRETGIFPTSPIISTQDWNAIVLYYFHAAPERPLPQDPRPEIKIGLKHFQPEPPLFRRTTPSTTLVKISESARTIFAADAETQSIDILKGDGALLQSIKVNNIPVSLVENADSIFVASIGSFQPSEQRKGTLIALPSKGGGFSPAKVLLEHLPRTTCLEMADLNRDGKPDFILSMYGNNAGRLSWFENRAQETFEERVLLPKSGAIRTET
ncbi:MAG: hypothetical protein AB1813_20265, partial [Verrucomicrobiota bacterium]